MPVFIYFDVNRRYKTSYTKQKEIKRFSFPQFKGYENCIYSGTNFKDFEDWFLEIENLENREKIAKKDFEFTDIRLEILRMAVNLFFDGWEMQNIKGIKNINREVANVFKYSSLGIEKNGVTMSVSQLSDGERQILLLVADIARRLTIANPSLDNPLAGEGVVLVDEIDLFLHPAWQRKIIPNLRKTFPNIQFIVTTHSPQVLSSVKKENAFILDDFQVYKSAHTQGRDSNSILADVFGVRSRPEFAEKEFRRLYQLIDDPEKVKEAQEMLEKMKEKYGEEDTEIVRAQLHLEFLAGQKV